MAWLRLILAALLAGPATGCSQQRVPSRESSSPTREESLLEMDPARIQADTMGFADRFVTAMTGVYDELERSAPTPLAKGAAHELKTDLALGAISNAVNPRPIAGMMDMVVVATLLRQIAEDPWTARTFGAGAPRLVEALQRQEADVRSMASQYLTNQQLAELTQLADQWRRANPEQRSVSHVHLADLPEANRTPREPGSPASSVFGLLFFDPTSNLDPAVREIELARATTERMFFYVQRMPLLLRLQIEGLYRQMLEAPELKRALVDVSEVAGSTTRFADVSSRFTDVVGRFPQQLSAERQRALEQVAAGLAQERDAAIGQMTRALRQEQEALVSNVEAATDRSINRLLTRLAVLELVVIGVLLAAAAFVYRRLRRPHRVPRDGGEASREPFGSAP